MTYTIFAIFHADGSVSSFIPTPNNPNEYPPPFALEESAIAVEINDDEGEITGDSSDHVIFHNRMKLYRYTAGRLHPKGNAPPLKAQVTEKFRMSDGILEDNTTSGWKRRAIFEPELDDNGEEIEGPDGMPEGRWYGMGQWGERKDELGRLTPNFIEIPEPDPQDRRVWKGTQGNEIEPETPVIPE